MVFIHFFFWRVELNEIWNNGQHNSISKLSFLFILPPNGRAHPTVWEPLIIIILIIRCNLFILYFTKAEGLCPQSPLLPAANTDLQFPFELHKREIIGKFDRCLNHERQDGAGTADPHTRPNWWHGLPWQLKERLYSTHSQSVWVWLLTKVMNLPSSVPPWTLVRPDCSEQRRETKNYSNALPDQLCSS